MPIYPYSRYRHCVEYADDDGLGYLDEREPFAYQDVPDNRFHTVIAGDTWWGLAALYLPTEARAPALWWLLCEYQPDRVVDPTIVPTPGTTVVIPPWRLVRMEVFSAARRGDH